MKINKKKVDSKWIFWYFILPLIPFLTACNKMTHAKRGNWFMIALMVVGIFIMFSAGATRNAKASPIGLLIGAALFLWG